MSYIINTKSIQVIINDVRHTFYFDYCFLKNVKYIINFLSMFLYIQLRSNLVSNKYTYVQLY
jgi:hypothetical protein